MLLNIWPLSSRSSWDINVWKTWRPGQVGSPTKSSTVFESRTFSALLKLLSLKIVKVNPWTWPSPCTLHRFTHEFCRSYTYYVFITHTHIYCVFISYYDWTKWRKFYMDVASRSVTAGHPAGRPTVRIGNLKIMSVNSSEATSTGNPR